MKNDLWDESPEWANYVTQDPDGTCTWHQLEPEADTYIMAWMSDGLMVDFYYPGNLGHWLRSLQTRPK